MIAVLVAILVGPGIRTGSSRGPRWHRRRRRAAAALSTLADGAGGQDRVLGVVLRRGERRPGRRARHHRAHQRRAPAGARHADRRLGPAARRRRIRGRGPGARTVALTVPDRRPGDGGRRRSSGPQAWWPPPWCSTEAAWRCRSRSRARSGWSMAPCAPSTATDWYFAHGATAQGGGLDPVPVQPGATDAVVNISLVSSTAGYLAPAAYQGIDVRPGRCVTENIGDHAADDGAVATEVSTLSGAHRGHGAAVGGDAWRRRELAHPRAPGRRVPAGSFPRARASRGGTVAFHVLNPTTNPGRGVGGHRAVPGRGRGAPGHARAGAVPRHPQRQSQTRIPDRRPYSLTFTSTGAGDRREPGGDAPRRARPPASPKSGTCRECPGGATRWLLPAVVAPGNRGMGAGRRRSRHRGRPPCSITTPSGRAIAGQPARRVEPGSPLVIGPHPGPAVRDHSLRGGRRPDRSPSSSTRLPVAVARVVVVPAFVPSS